MSGELVTVIVPYYKHKEYVEECILSIINQSHVNIELIVIDDGSPDDGWMVIERLAEKHNFLFIRKENEGLCKTLNLGLKLAKGKYFCAVASDDVLFQHKLEYQLEFLKKEQLAVCSAGAVCGTSFDNTIEKANEKSMKYKSCSYKDLLFFRGNVFAVNLLWATSLLKDLGGYDESTKLEDLYILLKYTSQYGSIKSLTCDLAFYRIHGANLSADRCLIFEERMLLIKKVDFIKNKQQVLAVNQVLIYFLSKNFFKFIMKVPRVIFLGGSIQLLKSLKYNLMRYL
jgi:alpha-1,3-rhamnosyltransferase